MALGADDEGSAESTATDNRVDSPALRAYPSSSDSTTSASEEDVASMDEDPQEDRYVIPARRQPNTDGPVRQRSRRLTVPQSPDLQRRRPSTRQRRPPQRYRAGDTVMGQLHTFSVPASDVVFLCEIILIETASEIDSFIFLARPISYIQPYPLSPHRFL